MYTKQKLNPFLVLLISVIFYQTSFSQSDKQAEALNYMIQNGVKIGISPNQTSQMIVSDAYESRGIKHYYYQQTIQQIPVYNALMNVVIPADGKGRITANRFTPVQIKDPQASVPLLGPEKAIETAAEHLNLDYFLKAERKAQGENAVLKGGYASKYIFSKGDISTEDIVAELVWVKGENQLYLCWNTLIHERSGKDIWNVRVNALSGEVVEKNSYTAECDFHELYNTPGEMTGDGITQHFCIPETDEITQNLVTGDYNIFDAPLEAPSFGSRTVVNAPWTRASGPASSAVSLQWHNDGTTTYTITRGNNVWAKEDIAADNETTIGASPSSPSSDFNFPYNGSASNPITNQDAAVTNLFFWNNIIHDILYQYGFDEPSGNFQMSNLGRGGSGNDYVNADAFDGAGTNNANFSTPPDGQNPRMQMFVWNRAGSKSVSSTPIGTVTNVGSAAFGPQNFNVTASLILAQDGTAPVNDICQSVTNNIAGKIALIDRGTCNFINKVNFAQNAGAVGVIIVNNTGGSPPNMPGSGFTITIPCLMVSQSDGNALKSALLGGPVSLTMQQTIISVTSDFDNGVITHEYGHGVSNRLTGGPSNTGCLSNAEQMGEGWSDYLALMLTTNWTTANKNDLRGIGSYVAGGGIRQYPYSYNLVASPYDYNYARNNTGVHALGSAWAAMLWDVTWNIVDVVPASADMYNGTGGNNIALNLVMEAMKLQPCQPGFADGRDAILLADELLYNGVHKCLIWQAFARRGMGFSASQGSSNSMTDGAQATDMPPAMSIELNSNKSSVYNGETVNFTADLECGCSGNQNGIVPTVTLPAGLMHLNGGSASGQTVTFPSTNFVPSQKQSFSFTATLNNLVTTAPLFTDGAEGAALFTAVSLLGSAPGYSVSAVSPITGNNSWQVPADDLPSDKILVLNTPVSIPGSNYSLHFSHEFITESSYDGGIVEFSVNGGTSWTDAQALFTQNGYNQTIVNTDNTLTGRQTFGGSSNGVMESVINLSSFSGASLLVRFRLGTDTGNGGFSGAMPGWKIDNVWVYNEMPCLNVTAEAIQSGSPVATDVYCQHIAPVSTDLSVICPSGIVSCSNVVTYPSASTTNGEGGNMLTYSTPSGSTFPSGITTVTVTATDTKGNTATCSFNVEITGQLALAVTPAYTVSTQANASLADCIAGPPYTLYYRRVIAGSLWSNQTVGGNTAVISGLLPATTYVSYFQDGSGNISPMVSFTTSGTPPCSPVASNLAATVNCNQISVSWTGSSTSYNSYVRQVSPVLSGSSNSLISTGTSRTFTVPASGYGGTYEVSVAGKCGTQYTSYASPVYVSVPTPVLPAPATVSFYNIGCKAITLSWTPVAGATNYNIKFRNPATNTINVNAFTSGTVYTKTNLSSNFTYEIWVTPIGCNGIYGTPSTRYNVQTCTGTVTNTVTRFSEEQSPESVPVFAVYPNPTDGFFTVSLENLSDEQFSIDVLSALGQTVYSLKETAQNGKLEREIRLPESVPPGNYLIRITGSNTQLSTILTKWE